MTSDGTDLHPPDLAGQTALVTGGGGDIGAAICRGLARAGVSVVVADLDEAAASAVAAELTDAGDGSSHGVAAQVDVTNPGSVEALYERISTEFSGLDILVNNAGVGRPGSLAAVTEDDLCLMVDVNVMGAFRVLRGGALLMLEQGSGSIVNMASITGFVASMSPNVVYDMTKGAIRQMTISAAAELAPQGIRVNAIAPGTIAAGLTTRTPMTAERRAKFEEVLPIGRLGEPQDLVGAALYLCSTVSSYVCGHVLVVDGGRILH